MRSLDIIACGGFIAALIALPFSFYCFHRAPIRSALFFGVPILVSMAAADTSQRLTHDQILDKLDALKGDYHISISGRAAQNPGEIVAALKKLDWLAAHHSSPTKRTTVEISDGSHIMLELARDSGDPREYWVFYPKYYITKSNEVGRIITPLFDAY